MTEPLSPEEREFLWRGDHPGLSRFLRHYPTCDRVGVIPDGGPLPCSCGLSAEIANFATRAAVPDALRAPDHEATPDGATDWPSIAKWWQDEAYRQGRRAETAAARAAVPDAATMARVYRVAPGEDSEGETWMAAYADLAAICAAEHAAVPNAGLRERWRPTSLSSSGEASTTEQSRS